MPVSRIPLPWEKANPDLTADELRVRHRHTCHNCGEPEVTGQPHCCGALGALAKPPKKSPKRT